AARLLRFGAAALSRASETLPPAFYAPLRAGEPLLPAFYALPRAGEPLPPGAGARPPAALFRRSRPGCPVRIAAAHLASPARSYNVAPALWTAFWRRPAATIQERRWVAGQALH